MTAQAKVVILSAAKNPLLSVILSEGRSPKSKDPEESRPATTSRRFLPRYLGSLLSALFVVCTALHAQPASVTGQAIYAVTQQFLTAAPHRYNGSPGHLAAEEFIKAHFKPEAAHGNFETDQFTANTPVGPQTMRNYIAKFPGKREGIIVLASHYETNYPLKDVNFVGANDGACTSALLIELGAYFRTHPPQGYSIWIVFDDGEEAVANPPYDPSQWGPSNNLYGTRHLAARWFADGTLAKIKAFLLADMIGDKDLNIIEEMGSTSWLRDLFRQASVNTHHTQYVYQTQVSEEDDHVPFLRRGVPSLDVIDVDYGPHTAALPDGYHHTTQDTIDKVSPKSLQISADLFLETIRLIDHR